MSNAFGINNRFDIHHRWDDINGFRLITLFTRHKVIGTFSEAEHLAQLMVSTISKSMKSDSGDLLENSSWVYAYEEARNRTRFARSMTPAARQAWDGLPESERLTEEELSIQAAILYTQMMMAGDFRKVPDPFSPAYDAEEHSFVIAARRWKVEDGSVVSVPAVEGERRLNSLFPNRL